LERSVNAFLIYTADDNTDSTVLPCYASVKGKYTIHTCWLRTMDGGIEKKKPHCTPSRATEGLPSKACRRTLSAPNINNISINTSCKHSTSQI